MELAMENLGSLHGVPHSQPAELLSPAHGRQGSHRNLVPHGRPAMVSGMASILEGGDYRAEHSLAAPLHPAMSMSCESPSGMSLSSTYTTLTPLQHLPPISTVSEKFHHPHHHHHHHHPHQRLAGNVSGSFTLMRDERSLASMGNLYSHYPKDMPAMGQPLSPLPNGLGSLHNAQQPLAPYGPGGHLPNEKMLSPNGFDSHAAMLSRGEEHLARGLAAPSSAMMPPLNGMHPHGHPHGQPGGALLGERERQASATGSQPGGSGQVEEINTKEVAQRITAELKRYSIPQAIFAQRILCRSQGTLSDLLRNPKPWSKLKSGRETFRRMWKWLQEPEFQRMSALRLAASFKRLSPNDGGSHRRAPGRLRSTPAPGTGRGLCQGESRDIGDVFAAFDPLPSRGARGSLWDRERIISPQSNGGKRESGCPGGAKCPFRRTRRNRARTERNPPLFPAGFWCSQIHQIRTISVILPF
ncbi:one cut domain family member 3 isoform X1 [Pezoporus flaviventris]|uniref:one cut domain family member 3 isoform X1 n=1 Tax=Pezoporus flaviventris TaxID=889875 RepID=UPI002AB2DCAA|nr:one cut domain family member 3 isoform X1 [Pezoporus flaviventris]